MKLDLDDVAVNLLEQGLEEGWYDTNVSILEVGCRPVYEVSLKEGFSSPIVSVRYLVDPMKEGTRIRLSDDQQLVFEYFPEEDQLLDRVRRIQRILRKTLEPKLRQFEEDLEENRDSELRKYNLPQEVSWEPLEETLKKHIDDISLLWRSSVNTHMYYQRDYEYALETRFVGSVMKDLESDRFSKFDRGFIDNLIKDLKKLRLPSQGVAHLRDTWPPILTDQSRYKLGYALDRIMNSFYDHANKIFEETFSKSE